MSKKKSINKVQAAMLIISAVLVMSSNTWAATYYVRPVSGEYGAEDGSSYANAFDGFADIAWGSLGGGDTLFVAGTHSQGFDAGASGTNDSTRLQIVSCTTANGCSTDDAGIIDGVSGHGLEVNSYNWVTIDGLTVQNGSAYGIRVGGTSQGVTIANCDVLSNGSNNVSIGDYAQDWIVEFNDIESSTLIGIGVGGDPGEVTGDGIIRYNYIYGNGTYVGSNCTNNSTGGSHYHNIYISARSDGIHTIYGNVIAASPCGQGVKLKSNGSVYLNKIYDNEDNGIMFIGLEHPGETINQYAYNNIIYENEYVDRMYFDEGFTGTAINVYAYNNTIYQTDLESRYIGGFTIGSSGAPDLFVAKNNIIDLDSVSNLCYRFQVAPSSSQIDYNWCNTTSGSPYKYGASYYNLSGWQGLGFDTNGDKADPSLVNPPSDMSLQSDSPCIDAGENLGATYQMALHPSTTWTRQNPGIVEASVVTANQNSHGAGWEVGAFVFDESKGVSPSPPTGLRVVE